MNGIEWNGDGDGDWTFALCDYVGKLKESM